MKLQTYGKNGKTANFKAQKRIEEIEKLISVTDSNSEIYKLNHKENNNDFFKLSPDVFFLVEYTLKCAEKTAGAFNPVLYPVTRAWGFTTKEYTVPADDYLQDILKLTDYSKIELEVVNQSVKFSQGMAFDFGAVGKGFAGDEAIKVLKSEGIESALLDLGGNIQVLGCKPDGSNWKIGLKNPWGGPVVAGLEVNDCAVITSGGYERYFTADDGKKYIHIFDGKTGKPVKNPVVSATIVTKSGLLGDFLSTTCFIYGYEKTVELWRQQGDFDFIMMFDDHSICYSKGLVDRISILEQFTSVTLVE